MNTETTAIVVSGIRVSVVRKPIKNLHLGVYPPHGRVRVAAPSRMPETAVRLAIVSRLGWIKRQQARFAAQPRQSPREMVSGESHYFLGRRYRLRVVEGEGPGPAVVLRSRVLELHVRGKMDAEERERALRRWYRARLRELILPLLAKWEAALGVHAAGWGIKKMKTKWGSYSPKTGRICLNLELAKKPVRCLEYIVVHELVHLIEPHHSERFASTLEKYLPT
jgi:hypothetical protein